MALIQFTDGSAAGSIRTAPPDDLAQAPLGRLLAVQHRPTPGPIGQSEILDELTSGYVPFAGVIFILNSDGAPLCELPWDEGTDHAADRTLTRLGLRRLHDWAGDRDGRRSVQVATAAGAGEFSGPAVRPPGVRFEPSLVFSS